jgi:hypothetical protein
MDAFAVYEARQRLTRWIEDGQSVLGVVPWLFDENGRLRAAAEAAEGECARLRHELDAVRAEADFLLDERGEIAEVIAEGLNRVMNEALQRLRAPITPERIAATATARAESSAPVQPEPSYS